MAKLHEVWEQMKQGGKWRSSEAPSAAYWVCGDALFVRQGQSEMQCSMVGQYINADWSEIPARRKVVTFTETGAGPNLGEHYESGPDMVRHTGILAKTGPGFTRAESFAHDPPKIYTQADMDEQEKLTERFHREMGEAVEAMREKCINVFRSHQGRLFEDAIAALKAIK